MEVLRTAILDMLRRKKDESFSSSDVVRQMFPQDWQLFMSEVNAESLKLFREGLIDVENADYERREDDSLKLSSPRKLE
tara:strand:- start:813 stop:1049 length:237 start_codon:yes stop_codon:yes gene_type:complete